jgi:hypothetical protein
VQVREAEDPPAAHASAAFEQVDASAALVAVRGEHGVAEESEDAHRLSCWRPVVALDAAIAIAIAFRVLRIGTRGKMA